jgi:hypothetical protein
LPVTETGVPKRFKPYFADIEGTSGSNLVRSLVRLEQE